MIDKVSFCDKPGLRKIITLIIMCSALHSFGQTCSTSIRKSTDRFTKKVSYYLKNPIERISVSKRRTFLMDILRDEEGTLMLICDVKSSDFGCTDEGSKLYFIFDDDSRLECYNHKTHYTCDGSVYVFLFTKLEYLPHNDELFNKLSNLLVTAIRIASTTNSYEVDINKKEAEKFRTSVKYISE